MPKHLYSLPFILFLHNTFSLCTQTNQLPAKLMVADVLGPILIEIICGILSPQTSLLFVGDSSTALFTGSVEPAQLYMHVSENKQHLIIFRVSLPIPAFLVVRLSLLPLIVITLAVAFSDQATRTLHPQFFNSDSTQL